MKRILFGLARLISGGLALSVLIGGLAAGAIMYPAQKYATQTTVYFTIYDSNSPWRVYETAPAAADVHVFQDGASEARAANAVTDLGRTFSLVLSAAEMTATIVTVDVNDASAPPLFGDLVIYIPTFGNASAAYPVDWSDSVPPVDVSTIQANAITAAAISTGAFTNDELATSFVDEIFDNTLTNNKIKQSLAWYVQRGGGGNALEISGTARAGGTSSTIVLAADSSTQDGAYIPCTVTLLTGAGAPTNRMGLTYTGSTQTLTIASTWPNGNPDATTTYRIDIPTTSTLASEGLAQAGTTNTIQLASGDVTADNMIGFVILKGGTGAGTTVYSVRDSWDANDTLAITGVWAGGATPDGTTYYSFTPSGNIVRDTYSYSYLTELYETTTNSYTYVTDMNETTITNISNNTTVTASGQHDTTVAAGANTTSSFILTSGPSADNYFTSYGWLAIVVDADNSMPALGVVVNYTGSTRTVTLDRALPFTPTSGDTVTLVPGPIYKPIW